MERLADFRCGAYSGCGGPGLFETSIRRALVGSAYRQRQRAEELAGAEGEELLRYLTSVHDVSLLLVGGRGGVGGCGKARRRCRDAVKVMAKRADCRNWRGGGGVHCVRGPRSADIASGAAVGARS